MADLLLFTEYMNIIEIISYFR